MQCPEEKWSYLELSFISQKTFGEYTKRTDFERPLTSGVAYALKVPHLERKQFEEQHGWTIKKMGTEDQTLVQDCIPDKLDPAPIQDEYAPVIFSQETVSHIVSIDMMSGKVCFHIVYIALSFQLICFLFIQQVLFPCR
jgi:histidine kinase 2/3/4 (cytokinin receptor)